MICVQDCVRTKCLVSPNLCDDPQNLTLGTLANTTDYTVYIEDQNNNNLRRINVTSSGAGIITINMADHEGFFHPNTTYQLWVTLEDDPITDVVNITQTAVNYTCLILEFNKVTTDGGTVVTLATQNIEVDV